MYVNNDACMSTAVELTPVKKRPIKESIGNMFEMLNKARSLSGDIRIALDDEAVPDPNANVPTTDGSCMIDALADMDTIVRSLLDDLFLIKEIIQG